MPTKQEVKAIRDKYSIKPNTKEIGQGLFSLVWFYDNKKGYNSPDEKWINVFVRQDTNDYFEVYMEVCANDDFKCNSTNYGSFNEALKNARDLGTDEYFRIVNFRGKYSTQMTQKKFFTEVTKEMNECTKLVKEKRAKKQKEDYSVLPYDFYDFVADFREYFKSKPEIVFRAFLSGQPNLVKDILKYNKRKITKINFVDTTKNNTHCKIDLKDPMYY